MLQLEPRRFALLTAFAHDDRLTGGYRAHAIKWRGALDEADRTVRLDADDVAFIQRQIVNREGGGWQHRVANIFVNTCAPFTGLACLPRKKPEARRSRGGRAGAVNRAWEMSLASPMRRRKKRSQPVEERP
jgi:hypothetical protein